MTPLLIVIGLIAGAFIIYHLLVRIAVTRGEVEGDAADIAAQVLAEVEGFRGSRSDGTPAWDGQRRIAHPTKDDGGFEGVRAP
ncbi:MAG TPA: hypothetical protein VFZ15_01850 [Acidimicrobiia bacterium]|nr:hypothetical protein [Acidimicrobiia bacterium]